jgi:hypothetical protein
VKALGDHMEKLRAEEQERKAKILEEEGKGGDQ